MDTKKNYIAPALKVFSFETELGYTISLLRISSDEDIYNSQGQENWSVAEDDNDFFDRW